ncbi:unnamed protein product, partial [Mesorhabditis belari]|uniref:Uncharacterized protein n=1 Tax=Mesorhabditis belari TaxID=2138241 RepID=A0AAF3FR71_9BILA
MRILYSLSTLCFLLRFGEADSGDQLVGSITKDGSDILKKASTGFGHVRQCSCGEQSECVAEMKRQATECNRPCFERFHKVTSRVDQLFQCFDEKAGIIEGFLGCFETQVDGCVSTMNGPQIPKTDISSIFTFAQNALERKDPTLEALLSPIKHILDSAGEWALCLKECFLQRNSHGFCFDRKGCQPKLEERKAKKSFKRCTHKIHWKDQAGDLCHCSADAGLDELNQYCLLFDHMKSSRRSHRKHG